MSPFPPSSRGLISTAISLAGNGHVAPAPTPVANAGPLGLSAFAITTFLLSMVNAGLLAKGAEPIVFGMALMVGGLAQVLAGMWEFRAGNTFAGTAFVAYGTFWLSFWALVQFYVADIPQADVGCRGRPLPDRLGHLHRVTCSSPRSRRRAS